MITRISASGSASARPYRNRDVAPLNRKSICEHFDGSKSSLCVILRVPYFIIHCDFLSVIKNKC